uniref:Uncharacterized protein LOC104211612 n=1 Tax=Nicotiana sylvestris TaxID=4096 RepID=A0A1U7V217_NICSY|nr:PREDICTED: uncharacterized protein LOC104211612 [Nicotiana sylvestris]
MESEQQVIEGEDEDFLTPQTFVVPEESDLTKLTFEELEQVILIEYMPKKKILSKITTYKLSTNPRFKLVKQKRRPQSEGSGLGIVLKPPTGDTIGKSIKTPRLTNNEAEYEAMISGLELAKSLGAKVIEAKCDSLLVVNQVNKSLEV